MLKVVNSTHDRSKNSRPNGRFSAQTMQATHRFDTSKQSIAANGCFCACPIVYDTHKTLPQTRRSVINTGVIGPIPDTPNTSYSLSAKTVNSHTVEVLNGNQAEPSRTRRRGDQLGGDQRALSWFTREGDIALFPHSPLALADVLNSDGGCFDLVAAANDQIPSAEQNNVEPDTNTPASLQQRRQRKHPRTRANILSQLTQEELLECCKRVQVENALVKRIGVKRLYLTAGFLCWKDSESGTVIQRAPLLFYPATLVRKITDADRRAPTTSANTAVSTNADESEKIEYEIRMDSNVPDTNALLRTWCHKNAEFDMPDYTPAQSLQDYFAQLAQAISGCDNIELQFDVALGNAAPPTEQADDHLNQTRLPALPEHFDTSLAMAITGNKNLQQLHSVLNLLKDYRGIDTSTQLLPNAANEAAGVVSNLHEYSKKLASSGLAGVEFQHLPTLPDNISKWVANVSKAMDSEIISNILKTPQLNARHLIRLAGVIELIDKAPLSIEQFKHADLCFSATPGLLQRAKHQARLIEDELSTLQNTFVLDKVPAKKQLLSLINELGGQLDEGPDIVDADYFNARRQFMEFSIEKPTNLTPEHRSLLGKLAKVLRFRELFVNNTEYRLALGPGYRGLRTDWDTLTSTVEYAQEISEVLESESLAACALGKWNEFRSTYVREFEVLQKAAESLRKLLWICGSDWQTKPVSNVLEQAEHTRLKLMAWSDVYGEISEGSSNTPAKVLAQFSGRSQEDVMTELVVGETQATIEEHISGNGASPDSVVETIEWLRLASQTASDLQLEITAIVEHLHIA